MAKYITPIPHLLFLFLFLFLFNQRTTSAVDFLFNSFNSAAAADLTLIDEARIDSTVLRLTNDSNQFSIGRAFYKTHLTMVNTGGGGGNGTVSSFSTSFVFSILPQIPSSPGFGLAFVLSNSTSPPDALSGQYFGLFSNSTRRHPAPLFAVEFDTGQNPEFNDRDGSHVGIDLNYIESSYSRSAGYYLLSGELVSLDMRSGRNIRAWIEFDGTKLQINVTIAPADMTQKPSKPLVTYTDPDMANYLSPKMFVGFSASKVTWVEAQRVLAWSLSDTGRPARDLNTSNLPVFQPPPSPSGSSSPSAGLVAGVTCAAMAVTLLCLGGFYYIHFRRKKKRIGKEKGFGRGEEVEEEWELDFWPRRFSYEDIWKATSGLSRDNLLGYGGFGKVYKGVLPKPNAGDPAAAEEEEEVVAVKCVSHDSKQGLREFMAEISSMGRLQHKSLIQMRGWCRRGQELMLVYDYMPNGSLNQWIFPPSSHHQSSSSSTGPKKSGEDGEEEKGNKCLLDWERRKRVLVDVAEGLLYLHEGWEKVVLHRDVKPSNILLDKAMRGRLGDFGLAKLHGHGEAPTNTRVVGTLGYLAPELAREAAPTSASDVYSYGVVVLEACCGRKAIELSMDVEEDDFVLVDWVRKMYTEGKVAEAVDGRMVVGEGGKEEVELVVKLGLASCHPDPGQRPTMKEVVEVLVGPMAKTGGGGN